MKPKSVKPVQRITRRHAEAIIEAAGGTFYGVTFRKKPQKGFAVGEERRLNTRNNVHKKVLGTGSPIKEGSTIRRKFDVKLDEWRSLDLATVSEIRTRGVIYKVED